MKLKKLAIAAALGAASSFAMAGGFDGPFVQLGIGGSGTWGNVGGVTSSGTGASVNGTSSQGNVNGLVSGGYSQSIGDAGFNLAANLFYVIGNQNAGNPTASAYNQSEQFGNAFNLQSKLKNTWGISVEPGWNFSKTTLGYAKLAWVNSTLNSNLNYTDTDGDNQNFGGNKNINGFGYGLGVKQMFTDNIYGAIDLMGVTYGSNGIPNAPIGGTSIKVNQFMGFASIGYKF